MPFWIRFSFLLTDIGFIIYWTVTALAALSILNIPPEWLYADYLDPNIVAWNWSFMPLDLLASATGLVAVSLSKRGKDWRAIGLISLVLTFCAGFMAITFWIFQGSFNPSWWAFNLALMIWPLIALWVAGPWRFQSSTV